MDLPRAFGVSDPDPDMRRGHEAVRRSGGGGALVLVLALIVGACLPPATTWNSPWIASSRPRTSSHEPTVAPTRPSPSAVTSPATPPTGAPSTGPSSSPGTSPGMSCAATTLASLSEEQRIGQLFMVGLAHDKLGAAVRDAVRDHHFGSWWFTTRTSSGVDQTRAVSDAIQALTAKGATGGIGFFIAANQEGGQIQALSGPGFATIPSAVIQGTWSERRLRARAERWGRELLAAGVNLDFAPVADVVPAGTAADNAPIGQLDRQYGSDPEGVAQHVAAFIDGMAAAGVVTTAKHFPGLGRVAENTDFASGVVDTITTADDPSLDPFRRAVDAGVPAVMLSLATYKRIDPDHLAAFSWPIIGGILEDDLGFGGIVMSDSMSAEAVSSIPVGTRAVAFLEDGGDMIVVRPVAMAVEMATAIAAHARESSWFRRRIDNAVLHILHAKEAAGLLPCPG